MRAGFDASLDELRALRDESRRVIASLQASYAKRRIRSSCASSTITFSAIFSKGRRRRAKSCCARLQRHLHSRQTMAGAMRFSRRSLPNSNRRSRSSADRALALELDIFRRSRHACSRAVGCDQERRECAGGCRCFCGPAELAQHATGRVRCRRHHVLCDRSRASSVVEAAGKTGRCLCRQNDCTLAKSRKRPGRLPSSPDPTWPVSRLICGRMR